MNCKLCNTRLSPGERTCPNCGNDAGPGATKPSSGKSGPLPSPKLSRASDPDEDIELELNEVSGESLPPEPPKKKLQTKVKSEPKPKKAAKTSEPSSPFALDPAGLRSLLTEQPWALEEGLSIFRDEDGKSAGAGYSTPVGDIDLLATDAEGAIVVVTVMEKSDGEELVGEVLKRVGWARKHLAAAEGRRVRGIVLCDEPPESLSYTAAAVADTVSFKTYRISLSFDDIEI